MREHQTSDILTYIAAESSLISAVSDVKHFTMSKPLLRSDCGLQAFAKMPVTCISHLVRTRIIFRLNMHSVKYIVSSGSQSCASESEAQPDTQVCLFLLLSRTPASLSLFEADEENLAR